MNTTKRIFKATLTFLALSAALFSLALWPSVQGATSASPISMTQAALKLPKISITITIGRASKGCRGFGLCKITLGKLAPSEAARSVNAELSEAADGKLQLTLLGKAPEEGKTLFVDQDISLSPEIAKRLGVKNATIQKGEYAFGANKSALNARLTR